MALSCSALGTTYYIDFTNGLDTRTALQAQSKSTPWKNPPGSNAATSNAASVTLAPGDQIILKGCVTWSQVLPWTNSVAGTAGNVIYFGVDQTWWDNTVSGCASAWNRPIFDQQSTASATGDNRLFLMKKSYWTLDNFEVINVLAVDDATNHETHVFDWFDNSETNVTVSNPYVHKWVNPYFSVGTGNIAASGTSVTNFVPYSYSPSPSGSWTSGSSLIRLQAIPCCNIITAGNSSPTVTSITGTNPYTINFTESPSNTGTGCTGCTIQIGADFLKISAGIEGQCSACVLLNAVFDGSDTAEALLNPYGDCGLTESNNQFCVTSAVAVWRVPNIVQGNVFRYIQSAAVGECTEWSTNLIEYIRLSTDPTAHTNGIECLDEAPVNSVTLSYGNVIRHANNPNASVPGGNWSIGLLNQYTPKSGSTEYIFNNVVYDTLQNVPFGLFNGGSGCCGTLTAFNNTGDAGASWTTQQFDLINSCPIAYTACTFENNHLISKIGTSVLTSSCGSNCTHTTNLFQSYTTANGQGYTATQSPYAYFPTSGGSTIGAGTSLASLCTTIASANAAAGAACLSDAVYAVGYNASTHTVTIPGRAANLHGTTWDNGAFQFAGGVTVTPSGSLGNGAIISGGAVIR